MIAADGSETAAELFPEDLGRLLGERHAALQARCAALAPALAPELIAWMAARAGPDTPPERYFLHPWAFPLMALPWWLEEGLRGRADPTLQGALMTASMSGYYLIRLIDDVMDRSPAAAPHLLPAIGLLHAEFQSGYMALFPADDPFWEHFHRAWAETHEAAVLDSRLSAIDGPTFRRISARKVAAASIPAVAVARRHGQEAMPPAWAELFAELCAWHQLHNDMLDWWRDHAANRPTWFLCGLDGGPPEGSVAAWVAREGFDRGLAHLEAGLDRMAAQAQQIGSPGLTHYLAARRAMLRRVAAEVRPGLAMLAALSSAKEA